MILPQHPRSHRADITPGHLKGVVKIEAQSTPTSQWSFEAEFPGRGTVVSTLLEEIPEGAHILDKDARHAWLPGDCPEEYQEEIKTLLQRVATFEVIPSNVSIRATINGVLLGGAHMGGVYFIDQADPDLAGILTDEPAALAELMQSVRQTLANIVEGAERYLAAVPAPVPEEQEALPLPPRTREGRLKVKGRLG